MRIRINPADNVAVETDTGHKIALQDICKGEDVIKYGFPIGHATQHIVQGEHVHTHNLATSLKGKLAYEYHPRLPHMPPQAEQKAFLGYLRENGEVGIRNDVWIVNTVGCVNKIAEAIAKRTGALAFPHPYGCSQLGADHQFTQRILSGMVHHPNAGGVLVLGLGCENNNIPAFKKMLGGYREEFVKFLNVQDVEDELGEGVRLVLELQRKAAQMKRVPVPISKLKIGLKCGGSDGLSGITANPLVGRLSDLLVAHGGSTVLTEVPEMFGAETLLMERCASREVFHQFVCMIQDFKDYFIRNGQEIYENPSPGNKAGGITTLEEKSLGCVQKGGTSAIVDVLRVGDRVKGNGLHVLYGPGNDMVAVTNLMASGVHMILFTTGRGTPLGSPVPTIKISTNTRLYKQKPHWIDFDAGKMLNGDPMEDLAQQLLAYCIAVAEGTEACNERNGYREIAIFKDGVTL